MSAFPTTTAGVLDLDDRGVKLNAMKITGFEPVVSAIAADVLPLHHIFMTSHTVLSGLALCVSDFLF